MSVIFLAKQALNGLFATAAFIARSITNYTVASPSDLSIFGKPSNRQIAFDGYSNNIEAFICATSLKRKVTCDLNHYPIDPTHSVSVPILLPRTVFALKDKPTPDHEKRMLAAGKEMGLEKLELGKGHVYTIERPTIDFLVKVRKAAPDACTGVTDYSQLGATIQFFWLTQCVDLFLATNTYSFKPSDLGQSSKTTAHAHPRVHIEYSGAIAWGTGVSKETPMKARKIAPGWENRIIPDMDDAREFDSCLGDSNAVFVAKPSPLPSSTSWGLPSECPNVEGIHFPYFEGLHHSDTPFMRSMVNKHFFRNLGSSVRGPREAWGDFRSSIGPAATTPSGRVMNHILYGIDLALGTQTQLYLLFDKGKYFGFNLLGAYFSIWAGKFVDPMSAADLQAEMAKYRSHDVSLKDLTVLFKSKEVLYTDVSLLPKTALKHSQQVALTLGLIDQEKTHDDVLTKVEEAIGSLVFDGIFRTMNADSLEAAIGELLGHDEIPKGQLVYLPKSRTAWKMLSSPYFAPLASFGARSFSLRDRGGKAEEVVISPKTFKPKVLEKEKSEKIRTSLPFFEKPVNECVSDWGALVATGKGKFNFSERAIGSRGFLLRGEDMEICVKLLDKAREDKLIGVGIRKDNSSAKKNTGGDIVMGEHVNLGDLF